MPFKVFGFEIARSSEAKKQEKLKDKTFVTPTNDDGAMTVESGAYGSYVDLDGSIRNEFQLITKYREMSLYPECDSAIDDVVNEAIVMDDNEPPVAIDLTNIDQPEKIKKKIAEEFRNICKILDFNNQAYEIFRKWYIDGRIYYHVVIDEKNKKKGILDLKYIDPRQIRKVRVVEKKDENGVEISEIKDEFFVYNSKGIYIDNGYGLIIQDDAVNNLQGIKIKNDSVAFCHSGITDKYSKTVFSHLHKAIKPLNQLKMMEDALVIYRIARAPERRIFYIDVGTMSTNNANQYIKQVMARYREKMVYDVNTGELKSDKRHLSMMEDFWLPRREGTNTTEIDTLPGGENLGQMEDVEYFERKLYESLNVPVSRLEAASGFQLGRTTEIDRDEVKFNKFIRRIRRRFSILFTNLLETQLILKGIIKDTEWEDVKENLYYDFVSDNHFTELKRAEILSERLDRLDRVDSYHGKYFSKEWIMEEILQMSEEERTIMDKQIKSEDEEAEPYAVTLGVKSDGSEEGLPPSPPDLEGDDNNDK